VVRANFPGVNTVRRRLRDGTLNVHYYHRATGRPLEGIPGSVEFALSYAASEKLMRDRLLGTFNGLVREFTLSREFDKTLADSTKSEYRRMLTKAELEFGDMPIAALEDARVRREFLDWREKVAKASGEREADNRLSAISAMITWAVDRGKVSANHLRGFKRLYHADRAEKIWLPGHITGFMKVAPLEMQRALIMGLHTGQRQGDIRRVCWTNYDGTAITLRQGKSRRHDKPARQVVIPCTRTLRRMLDGMKRTSTLILTTPTGRPFTKRYFNKLWDKAAEDAGITDLHFHDLRGTAVTMLAEAGCTAPMIATITGHTLESVTKILEAYLARTRSLADQAIVLFQNAKATRFANRLQTGPTKRVASRQKNHA
jgi:integrase